MDKKNAKYYESTKYHLDECNATYKQAVSCIINTEIFIFMFLKVM